MSKELGLKIRMADFCTNENPKEIGRRYAGFAKDDKGETSDYLRR